MILKLNIEFQSFLHERMSKNSGIHCNYDIINAINLQIKKNTCSDLFSFLEDLRSCATCFFCLYNSFILKCS